MHQGAVLRVYGGEERGCSHGEYLEGSGLCELGALWDGEGLRVGV